MFCIRRGMAVILTVSIINEHRKYEDLFEDEHTAPLCERQQ
jgi:hypothetical protein